MLVARGSHQFVHLPEPLIECLQEDALRRGGETIRPRVGAEALIVFPGVDHEIGFNRE